MPRRVQRGGGSWTTAAKAVAKTAGVGALSALVNRSMQPRQPKPLKRTTVRKTARRGQAGGAFPLLVPAVIAGAKALATGALSGMAGYGAQKALKKLAKRKKRKRR